MSEAIVKARALLEARRAEVNDELAEVQQALRSLGSGPAPRRAPKTKSRTKQSAKPKPRTPRSEREASLLAYAKDNPTATNRAIADDLGVTPSYVSQMLKSLSEAGRVKRRRGKLVVRG